MRTLLYASMLTLASCAPSAARPPVPSHGPTTAAPHGPSVEQLQAGPAPYDVPPALQWAYDTAAAAVPGLEPDARLARAAGDLLAHTSDPDWTPRRHDRNHATRAAGVAEPVPLMLIVSADAGDETTFRNTLTRALPDRCRPIGCNRLGLASAGTGDERWLVVLAMASRLRLAPIPTRVQPGATIRIQGEAHTGNSPRIRILVAPPSAPVQVLHESNQSSFDLAYEVTAEGPHRFEILGELGESPTVLALFSVAVGDQPTLEALPLPPGRTTSPGAARDRVLRMVNAARDGAGLSTLQFNETLAAVAQSHADAMAGGTFFSHRDSEGRGPADRVAGAGMESPLVLENLAIAETAEQAFVNVLESPAHLEAMLRAETTDIGVGVSAQGSQALRVVVLMAQVEARLDGEAATERVIATIGTAREERQIPPLSLEAALTAAAHATADLLVQLISDGLGQDEAASAARRALTDRQLPALRAVLFTTSELGEAAVEPAMSGDHRLAGIAVRPARDPREGYHVVLLLARGEATATQ